jgi:lysophospholipase L1-like esterase
LVSVFAVAAGNQRPNPDRYAIPVERKADFRIRQEQITVELESLAEPEAVKLVFVGDSITDYWRIGDNPWYRGQRNGLAIWDRYFATTGTEYFAINLGVTGDRTEHVLHRLADRSDGGLAHLSHKAIQPDYISLLIGINNTWSPDDPDPRSIANGIIAVGERLHELRPNSTILVASLLPTDDVDRNSRFVEPINVLLRDTYQDCCVDGRIEYLDLHSKYVDNEGLQIAKYFYDGLHLNESGYHVWATVLLDRIADPR